MKKFFNQSIRVWMLMLLVGMLPQFLSAQLPMTRSVFTGTFTPVNSGSGGGILSTATGDDATQDGLPIGFTFNYLGTNYTTMGVSTNGWASFLTVGTANQNANANLFGIAGPNACLGPWWDDLRSDSIVYRTTGVPGSQVFTIHWYAFSYYIGSTVPIQFQLKLYEGTNVIEFHYGPTPTPVGNNTAESASIGIENTVGGAGNFLDAVSGSAWVNNSFMNISKWPLAFLRFTPGVPTPIPGGTYTVGSTGMMPSLSEALAMINHQGILGPVTLSLTDASYDAPLNVFPLMLGPVAGNNSTNTITIQPASGTSTLNYTGVASGAGGNIGSSTAFSATSEAIMYVIGTDYVTLRNLNFVGAGASPAVDRGLYVANASATDGSQNGLYENLSVSLIRSSTSAIGVQQNTVTTATAASGANSNNIYRNLSITNSYAGMYLLGTAAFPDLNCQIGNTSPTAFNVIGNPAVANDLGGGTAATATYGIRIGSQSGAKVFNNAISNVASTVATDGILCELSQGTTEIYMNKVSGVRNASTSSTANACGIRANVATTAGHSLRVYNNFVAEITSGYTGAATATRIVKGIFVQAAGGGVTGSNINVDANSVRLDAGTAGYSNSCYEIGTGSGPVINTRNNIFANFTGAQTAPATHFAWRSTATASIGNTGSVSNNNDLYVANATQGFTGQGNLTNYATLADWQLAMVGQDVNSVSVDPAFTSPTDLHAAAVALNAAANLGGSAWVTVDIDNQARSGSPDIGADEFVLMTVDASAQSISSPLAGNCYSATEAIVAQIRNAGVSPLDFTVNPCVVTVNITGAITATLNVTVNNNTLNGGSPLASGATLNVPVGTANMSAAGTYTFNASVLCTGDMNSANDAMLQSSINFQPGTATALRSSLCFGDSSLVTLSGNTASTIQWQSSTNGGASWSNIPGATSTSYMAIPSDTTWYRAEVCGLLTSVVDTIFVTTISNPVVTSDTVCGLDTLHLAASGNGTLNWYGAPTGGSILFTGTNLDTVLSATDTFYVSNSAGGGLANVGLTTNVGGGGQQTSTAYNTFDVFQACTLVGTYVYPGAAGNVVCDLRDNTGALITSRTVAVGAGDVGNRTYISLNIPLTPGTGYRLAQGAGSVSMFRNSAGVAYPYTLPGVLSITGSSAGASFYYFFYDWSVLTGCESPRVAVEAVVNPAASVIAAAVSTVICQGDTTSLTASSVNAGYSYSWTPSGSLSASTGSVVVASPLASTSYIVTGIDSVGCVNSDTVDVAVNLTPLTTVTGTADTICIGDTVAINGYAGPVFFQDTTDVPILDLATQTSVINVSGVTGTVVAQVCFNLTHTFDGDLDITLISPSGTTLDLTSDNGGAGADFLGTCFNMSAATNITAGTAPFTGTFVPEGPGGFTVFNGQNMNGNWTLQITDDAGGDIGTLLDWSIEFAGVDASYSWTSTPAGFVDSTASITVTPTVTTTYHLLLTDTLTGCDTTYNYTVYVHPALAASIVAPTIACNGAAITLTANISGGDGVLAYNWGGLSTADSLNVVVSSDTTFTLEVIDGCGSVSNDTATILLAQPLNVTILGPATACIGDTLALIANAVGGDGNYTYVWTPNLGTTATVVDVAGSSGFGGYSVSVTDGCNVSPAVGNLTVTFINQPVAAFSFTGGSLTYSFTNASVDATTYSWDFGDGNTSTAAAPTHTYAADGVYQVCLVASSNCGSDTTCQSITVVSTSKPFGDGVVQLWPNPARGQFNVRVEGFTGDQLNLELYSLSGQRVLVKSIDQVSTTIVETLKADLPAGTYYLRVNDGVNNATLRVVLE